MTKNVPAKIDEKQNALEVAPEWMDSSQGVGVENLDAGDVATPRIKLMQALSPELLVHDVKAGEYFHTQAEATLGKSVAIVPLYIDKRYVLWKPRDAGGGILARADDGIHWNPANTDFSVAINKGGKNVTWSTKNTVAESKLDQWGSFDPADPNSQPAATLMYTMIVMLPDYLEFGPAIISLQRSAVKVARGLIGKLKISNTPSFGRVFKMSTVQEQSPSGSFFNYKFEPMGFVQDKDHYEIFKGLYEQFRQTGVTLKDIDSMQDEEVIINAPIDDKY